jgi:hypothetical protein
MLTIRCEPCGKSMTPVRNLTLRFAVLLGDSTDSGKGEIRPDAFVCTNCGRVEFRVREPSRFSQ